MTYNPRRSALILTSATRCVITHNTSESGAQDITCWDWLADWLRCSERIRQGPLQPLQVAVHQNQELLCAKVVQFCNNTGVVMVPLHFVFPIQGAINRYPQSNSIAGGSPSQKKKVGQVEAHVTG